MKFLTAFVLLLSCVGASAEQQTEGILKEIDFSSARLVPLKSDYLVEATLSKAGLAKFKRLNETSVNKRVPIEIDGVKSEFLLREPIRTDKLQMGPYSEGDAHKVSAAINAG